MWMPAVVCEVPVRRALPRPARASSRAQGITTGPGHAATGATVLRLQRLAGNAAVVAALHGRRSATAVDNLVVQRCGDEVHPGCACASEDAAVAEAPGGQGAVVQRAQPVVQRACPASRPAGEEASSKAGAGLLTSDVTFNRKDNTLVVADFPVASASPPGGATTEPDWERAMSIIAGTPSVWPTVAILGFSDCVGSERLNFALRQKRADTVLGLLPAASKTKVMTAQPEYSGNFLTGNDTAEQRAGNRAVLLRILSPKGPKRTDACDMLSAAADLDQYIFLVRCVEKRIGRTTPADAPVVLSLLRQIYYGSPGWSLPSGHNPVWDDVVTAQPWSPGTDPGPMLGKKLFEALRASQTIQQNGKPIDLGHLLTGMDAARTPDRVSHVGRFSLPTNMRNHEWATWAGDVGSAAAMSVVCTSQMTFPNNDARYFTAGASDEDLDGDIDAYAMWAALNHGTPDVALRLDMTLSDALLDYYRTTKTIPAKGRASRYEVFVNFYGGEAKGGVIGKPAQLHARLAPSILDFALLYFGNEMKKGLSGHPPDYCDGTPAPTAPGRTVDAIGLLADVVVAADTMTARFVDWLTKRV